MKVKIRLMTVDDLETVIDLEKQIFEDPWSQKMIFDELNKNFYRYPFILEYKNKICGYAFIWAFNNEVHINNFAIHPDYRRKGLGIKLLNLIFDTFHDSQHYFLEVRKNNLAAIQLYEKCGFKIIETRPKYYSDGEDALLMHKDLLS